MKNEDLQIIEFAQALLRAGDDASSHLAAGLVARVAARPATALQALITELAEVAADMLPAVCCTRAYYTVPEGDPSEPESLWARYLIADIANNDENAVREHWTNGARLAGVTRLGAMIWSLSGTEPLLLAIRHRPRQPAQAIAAN
ncbi:hypothetical protein ABZ649_04770 [Streptomyces albidoflavus]|uniref:hypothetical protein n=1 Tax=Streptomyces albidoflavus TaxID=1886 RepID=UPI0033C4D988